MARWADAAVQAPTPCYCSALQVFAVLRRVAGHLSVEEPVLSLRSRGAGVCHGGGGGYVMAAFPLAVGRVLHRRHHRGRAGRGERPLALGCGRGGGIGCRWRSPASLAVD